MSSLTNTTSSAVFTPVAWDDDSGSSTSESLSLGRTSGASKQRHGSAAGSTGPENVKVMCRVRPFDDRELALQDEANSVNGQQTYEWQTLRSVITMEGGATQFLDAREGYCLREQFNFDGNLWSVPRDQQEVTSAGFADQDACFEAIGKPAIDHAWDGFNSTIFAYGQTGAGKTHTMMGTATDKGLIPRCSAELFRRIQEHQALEAVMEHTAHTGGVPQIKVRASFLEVYNEHVKDLLWELGDKAVQEKEKWDRENLRVRNIKGQLPIIVGLTTVDVVSWEECEALIKVGMKHRVVAATKMNDTSSRSHAVFRLELTQTTLVRTAGPTSSHSPASTGAPAAGSGKGNRPRASTFSNNSFSNSSMSGMPPMSGLQGQQQAKRLIRTSVISLVDLAGSERLKKSGAQGQRLKEAAAINQSLTTLRNVVDAIVEGRAVVPYRESQLTWLLAESLGGNSRTCMIACVSPHADNGDETLSTLRYASRAQGIVCHAKVNENEDAKRINKLRDEVEEAQKALNDASKEEKMELRRTIEEHESRLAELEQRRLQQMQAAHALETDLAKERKTAFTALYRNSFRLVLFERRARQLAESKMMLDVHLGVQHNVVSQFLNEVSEAEAARQQLVGDEGAAAEVRAAKEKELRQLQTRVFSNQCTKQRLQGQEKELAANITSKKLCAAIGNFVCSAVIDRERLHREKRRTQLMAQQEAELTSLTSENDLTHRALEETRGHRLSSLRHEVHALRGSLTSEKHRHEKEMKQLGDRAHQLHKEAIFFDRENKQLSDVLVASMTQLDSESSQKFESMREELVDRLAHRKDEVRIAQMTQENERRDAYEAKCEDLQSSIDGCVADGEAELEALRALLGRKLATLEADWSRRVDAKAAQVEETTAFMATWATKSTRYANTYSDLMRLASEVISDSGEDANNRAGSEAEALCGELLCPSSSSSAAPMASVAPIAYLSAGDETIATAGGGGAGGGATPKQRPKISFSSRKSPSGDADAASQGSPRASRSSTLRRELSSTSISTTPFSRQRSSQGSPPSPTTASRPVGPRSASAGGRGRGGAQEERLEPSAPVAADLRPRVSTRSSVFGTRNR